MTDKLDIAEMVEDKQEELRAGPKWLKYILISLGIFFVLAIYPSYCVYKGYRMARHADSHGIHLEVKMAFDGAGYSLRASEEAMAGQKEMDLKEYARLQSGVLEHDGVNEPVGFFYGLGTRIFHWLN